MKRRWSDPEERARLQASMKSKAEARYAGTEESRFWGKVDKTGGKMKHMPTNCWEWMATTNEKGYGIFQMGLIRKRATHAAIFFSTGAWPEGKQVCHRCDNPCCVRPEHLFLGTPKENTRDMVSKRRAAGPKGDKSATAKLTWEQVRAIRSAGRGYGTRKALAEAYGVRPETIDFIRQGKTWKE